MAQYKVCIYEDFDSVIFSPHSIHLNNLLENVQRQFTKRLSSMFNKEYNEVFSSVTLRLEMCGNDFRSHSFP